MLILLPSKYLRFFNSLFSEPLTPVIESCISGSIEKMVVENSAIFKFTNFVTLLLFRSVPLLNKKTLI